MDKIQLEALIEDFPFMTDKMRKEQFEKFKKENDWEIRTEMLKLLRKYENAAAHRREIFNALSINLIEYELENVAAARTYYYYPKPQYIVLEDPHPNS